MGEDRGIPFLAMPFLRGESLDARLQREINLPEAEALRIAGQTAEGLAAIHDLGLIHRDIKPGNVFLEGERGGVKILDFGLARASGADAAIDAGRGHRRLARVHGPRTGDPAAARRAGRSVQPRLRALPDAHGRLPFPGDDALATLLAVTTHEPRPAQELMPSLSADTAALVRSLLAKNPADRPASAHAVLVVIASLAA